MPVLAEMPTTPSGTPGSASAGGPRKVGTLELLAIRENAWAPRLRAVSLVAEAELRVELTSQVAIALGRVYTKLGNGQDMGVLLRWPACTAAAMVGAAVSGYEAGTYWPALWKSAKYQGNAHDQGIWGQAFERALQRLGMPAFSGLPLRYLGPILMHAGMPAYCLGDYFRLLLARRRRDPGMDADSFIAWATYPGRESRLSDLDVPARRFLINGGEYATDVVDRSLDLLERLGEPDPDLAGIRLPAYVISAARDELEAGRLDVSAARRRPLAGQGRQQRPRIGLDPFGEGVRVILPAIGDAPDGIAIWRVTADGVPETVQSRALWVGATEAAPETTYPLSRPVRTVLVSLAGRDLTAELQVVESADPILFFTDDGRQVPGSLSLPRGPVWILHPADRELVVTGNVGVISDSPVPFGWEGWRLRRATLDDVQAVALDGGRSHAVHGQARPRLVLGDPVRGVTTAYGSPVYDVPPRLLLPGSADAPISWNVDVRPAAGGRALVSTDVQGPSELDLGRHRQQPVCGAFEITVRGPLGRGMRRTVFVAERLAADYQPSVRALAADGLRPGNAKLTAAIGARLAPSGLQFGARERAHVVEYQATDGSEALVVTPPHVSLLCAGAGSTTWTAAPLHLMTETFGEAGRLLVRVPDGSEIGDLELWVGGARVQDIPASGQRTPGLAGYELARAGDTIAEHGRAELVISVAGTPMIAGVVRPRRLASGIEPDGAQMQLSDYRHVDGLMAGIYLVFAPWRDPVLQPVSADGVVTMPGELSNEGPARVLLRVEDPWTTASWPVWPGPDSLVCHGLGVPASTDAEERLLSLFVAGQCELPEHLQHPGRLWRLVDLADSLIRSGARPDLSDRCGEALRAQPRAALMSLLEADLDHQACITALIATGIAAIHVEFPRQEDSADRPASLNEVTGAGRLWHALPSAAAILTGELLSPASDGQSGELGAIVEDAVAQCGDSLREMLHGEQDPYATVGCFGRDAQRMATLSSEQVEMLWQAAAVVPQAFLDQDTRMAAARQMFDARRTPELRYAAKQAASVLKTAEFLIRESQCPTLAHELTARCHPDRLGGWLALPAMSIALALVARLAAHGNTACQMSERAWRHLWVKLASQAPDLVAIDLVRAEALIQARAKGESA